MIRGTIDPKITQKHYILTHLLYNLTKNFDFENNMCNCPGDYKKGGVITDTIRLLQINHFALRLLF